MDEHTPEHTEAIQFTELMLTLLTAALIRESLSVISPDTQQQLVKRASDFYKIIQNRAVDLVLTGE